MSEATEWSAVPRTQADEALRGRLEDLASKDSEYWSFRGKAVREHAHAYFQYPAMMVPQMQRKLIGAVVEELPDTRVLFDPFVGSGTTMVEAMMCGRDFGGQDINPLAVLLCRAKVGPFRADDLETKAVETNARIGEDDSTDVDIDFPGLGKWFRPDVAVELSRIRRAIRRDPDLWSRRFFWVALAETVRLTSNSRTSTFKLHTRPKDEIERRKVSPISVFAQVSDRNVGKLRAQRLALSHSGLLRDDAYTGSVDVKLGDSACRNPDDDACYDLLITSPPYGDNTSTIPYGQHSYLPLQWVDLSDIDDAADKDWLASTYEIDHRSLGGCRVAAMKAAEELRELSMTFADTVDGLEDQPRDRAVRVAAFCRDLNEALGPILDRLKPDAYMIWTVGNRRVGGRRIPVDTILGELLAAKGATSVASLSRTIPVKRMALKNSIADTMTAETILIMRKGEA